MHQGNPLVQVVQEDRYFLVALAHQALLVCQDFLQALSNLLVREVLEVQLALAHQILLEHRWVLIVRLVQEIRGVLANQDFPLVLQALLLLVVQGFH